MNPNYSTTFTFPNDFPALSRPPAHDSPDDDTETLDVDPGATKSGVSELFQSAPARGECHVMCFTPHSELALPLMEVGDIRKVVEEWVKLSVQLSHNVTVQVGFMTI